MISDAKRRIVLLIMIMVVVTLTALLVSFVFLYNTSIDQSRAHLIQVVKSQVQLINAVARFDAEHSLEDVEGGAFYATLQQIVDAHSQPIKIPPSESFEFTLARLDSDQIVFVQLDHQFKPRTEMVIPLKSNLAEPMRRALSGESGSGIMPDYLGDEVLASYEPLPAMGLGMVAKIKITDIQAPFIRAGFISSAFAFILILFGSLLFQKISSPLIGRLKQNLEEMQHLAREMEGQLHGVIENTTSVIYIKDLEGKYLLVNRRWEELFEIKPDEMRGKTDYDFFPADVASAFRENDLRVIRENRVIEMEESVPLGDGIHTYISVKFPLKDMNGKVYGVGGVSTDITERTAQKNLLRKIQERYEEAQEVAKIGHWELDLVENNLIWSKENCRVFGDDIGASNTYETFLERVHPDDREFVNKAYTGSVENRTQYDIEHRLLMGDGSVKWVHERCKTFYDEKGTPLRSIGTTQDITGRKLAEMRFKGIVEMAADAIISINEKQEVTLFNPAAERVFGIKAGKVLGKHVEMLMPERFWSSHRAKVEAFLDESDLPLQHRKVGMYGMRASGEEFPLESYISKQEVGGETIMTVMMRDLSDQMESNDLRRKLSKAIAEAGEAIIITDRNAVIEYVNPAFSKITGYSLREALGNTPAMLKSSAQDPKFYQEMWSVITAGEVWKGTLIDRRKDGSFYPAMMSVAPIHDDHGEITHFVSLQQDMTEYKKLEQQFIQAQKMEAIGTLVGGIAHDFNNMLAALQGNVFLAKSKLDDPVSVGERLDNVEKLSNRAAEIVRQLLTFARKDSVDRQMVPLNSMAKEAIKLAKNAIPENIEVVSDITDEPITVAADSTQLQQVIMNLLNNARDAVEETAFPAIKVSLKRYEPTEKFLNLYPEIGGDQALAHLSVEDNGCGIPQALVSKVVEPFFTTKGVGKGTGLGLSMVYGAVQRHNGIFEVRSEPGEGTAIDIYLPLLVENVKDPSTDKMQVMNGQGEVVLLVDDDETLLDTVEEVLKKLNYLVVEATNGHAALEYFREHRGEVSIILSDVVMPEMGGIELATAIREMDTQVPVVLMTGYDFSKRRGEVESLGNCKVIDKPVEVARLSRLVRKMLEASSDT